jgi:hypothetical protein
MFTSTAYAALHAEFPVRCRHQHRLTWSSGPPIELPLPFLPERTELIAIASALRVVSGSPLKLQPNRPARSYDDLSSRPH